MCLTNEKSANLRDNQTSSPAVDVIVNSLLHFMATRFQEVNPNRGVDDNAAPIPEMMVPLKGTNDILLIDGDGFDVKAENPHMLDITEVKDFPRKDLSKPHKFRLKGKALPGEGGLLVVARGKTVTVKLRVYVLDNRKVRLAVRPLQTASGVFHATKKLPDPKEFVSKMNEIWTPQANVLIELVPSNPALIDDPNQIASDLGFFEADSGIPDTKKGVFPPKIPLETRGVKRSFIPVFLSYLGRDPVKNTDFTLFVVHAIDTGPGTTYGATDKKSHKFALVSDDASARQWAHELGHHLGGEDSGKGELMESGEEGGKIPVEDAVKVFNRRHT